MSELKETAVQAALVDRLTKSDLGWRFVTPDQLPRSVDGVMLEDHVTAALIRLNPLIAAQPSRVEEVLPRLRAVLLTVANDGLIVANEQMVSWLCGRQAVRFTGIEKHEPVQLIDFENPRSNELIVSTVCWGYQRWVPRCRYMPRIIAPGGPGRRARRPGRGRRGRGRRTRGAC